MPAAAAEGGDDVWMDFAGAESVGGGDLGEPDQGVHHGQLSRVFQLETGDTFAGGGQGRGSEALQVSTIDKGLEDILLDVQVAVVDRRELVARACRAGRAGARQPC